MEVHSFNHGHIVWFGKLYSREQIWSDAGEQGEVLGEELGKVHVVDRPGKIETLKNCQRVWKGINFGFGQFEKKIKLKRKSSLKKKTNFGKTNNAAFEQIWKNKSEKKKKNKSEQIWKKNKSKTKLKKQKK